MAEAEKRVFLQASSGLSQIRPCKKLPENHLKPFVKERWKLSNQEFFRALDRRGSHQLTSNMVSKPAGTPNTPAEMG